jgi:cellulose synthase/poly-beta-1,6-N-acetylglucosamine synthase-like glycosyltransferase
VLAHKRVSDEVLVVDSAPKQSNVETYVLQCGVRYVLEPAPGISRARNHAARLCTTDIVVYIDDDAVPEPGWLEPLLKEFSDPQVVLAAGRVLPPESQMDTLRSVPGSVLSTWARSAEYLTVLSIIGMKKLISAVSAWAPISLCGARS